MVFIIGIFFYTILQLNTMQLLQNHRYEQIRKVEKLKEYKNAISWVALDIFIDKGNNEIVLKKTQRLNELFENVFLLEKSLIQNSESKDEEESISLIFKHFHKIQTLIKTKLAKNDFEQFNHKFIPIRQETTTLIIDNIDKLQNKLNETEQLKENFLTMIKIEIIVLLLVAVFLSFVISNRLIKDIHRMLKKLNNGILQLLNNNEQTIQLDLSKQNELNEITKNFNRYLEYKNEIILSREELLRNISHELKTPITKGKFLVEKLKEKKDETIIENINELFYDIEKLTSMLLQRERLNYVKLEYSTFKATTLIVESLSKLSIEDESILDIEIKEDFEINGDLYHLTLAVKNLLDNALKYSSAFPIIIQIKDQTITISNQAKKLSNGLVYYLQPFTREPNQQQGYGLGLNIVNKIVQIHNFKLGYSYLENKNNFFIDFKI